ncbi:HpcH/HpaI aldolase/citrate lyase family protein [Paramicrobacterium agarici]|uniref:Citrate lyase subunit beta/citryl-CoA lyase n=1 Tax=Paramicrobacterium agarici TaxID=630514 RepID=A0A2A9DWG7_9MICO|nr:CoA ester lyase [Microbacterium agarici]PFG31028.1 citrate lyase subunit beta/citryl-CoA lyase [Microbacterium agarici]TQO24092.1 citrate lyase subunit beta/citryl-CoA lyase [Microbacterium agarici]
MTFRMGPSLLFCPADRPERFQKAADRADAVILDLEDGVDPEARAHAREALQASSLDPATTIVRVNPADTADFLHDLEALRSTAYRTVMLSKTERVDHVERLTGYKVIALCETAGGIMIAEKLAQMSTIVGLMWGAEDLIASLGGSTSRRSDGRYRDVAAHARSRVLLAAGSAGKAAIDAVHLDIDDRAGLETEVEDAVACGFAATACIHPSQVPVIREGYRPVPSQVEWAQAVLDVARGRTGAFRFRGQMVDTPVIRHAEQVLRRAHAG